MTVQARKTYRKLSPEMLYDEIQDLLSRHGLEVEDNRVQTYGVPSGATQSRVAANITTNWTSHLCLQTQVKLSSRTSTSCLGHLKCAGEAARHHC